MGNQNKTTQTFKVQTPKELPAEGERAKGQGGGGEAIESFIINN